MAYILSAADGVNNPVLTLEAYDATGALVVGTLSVPYLQDVTVNNAQDIFTWEQLDTAGKFSVPTTSTNSLSSTIVVDPTTFFGTATGSPVYSAATAQGLIGCSTNKQKVRFSINMGDATTAGATGKRISGDGYVTGLSPTVSSGSPVWTTPITITCDGDFTITDAPA